jgi:hypothetical protein
MRRIALSGECVEGGPSARQREGRQAAREVDDFLMDSTTLSR